MTTHSKDTPYGRKYSTALHLVYRIKKSGELEAFGLFETREAAEENVALMSGDGWQIADILCLGWGIVAGKIERNPRRTDEAIDIEKLVKSPAAEWPWRRPPPR
jgi:hypothetical protein